LNRLSRLNAKKEGDSSGFPTLKGLPSLLFPLKRFKRFKRLKPSLFFGCELHLNGPGA